MQILEKKRIFITIHTTEDSIRGHIPNFAMIDEPDSLRNKQRMLRSLFVCDVPFVIGGLAKL